MAYSEKTVDDVINYNEKNKDELLNGIDSVQKEIRKLHETVYKAEQKKVSGGVREIDRKSLNDAMFIVKEYESSYVGDISIATDVYHAQQLGMKLRQLEVELKGGTVAFESGQFLDSIGQINIGRIPISPFEMVRGMVRKSNDESFFRPTATGHGTINLDSSFKFITLFPVLKPTRVVLEKGIYLASIGQFEFKTTFNSNAGYMLFSGKNVLQNDLRGTGVIALELPVRESELVQHKVTEDRPYRVNGDYVLMWVGNLKRTVRPMGKLFGSLASGTGLVEEYSGEGTVFTAPTLGYYKTLARNYDGEGLSGERDSAIEEGSQQAKRKTSFLERLLLRK